LLLEPNLATEPLSNASVPTIFHETGVRQTLENPPLTRPNGWNLATLAHAEIVEGTHLRLASGRRKLVEFYSDGALIAAGRFETSFGPPPEASELALDRLHRVNSLALVEFVHEFVLVAARLGDFIEPRPTNLRFTIGVVAAIGSPIGSIFLPPYGVSTWGWQLPDERASSRRSGLRSLARRPA
jgi:hypothetical protein